MDSAMGLNKFWLEAVNELDATFVIWGGDALVARKDVGKFLDWLTSKGKIAPRAEGFSFDGENFRALLECINDYSGDPSGSAQFHKDIIGQESDWKKAHFVEFLIEDLG
jgi:hypothetical protein